LLLTMLATQFMNTSGEDTTNYQTLQTTETTNLLSIYKTTSTHNDETMELPKFSITVPSSEKTNVPYKNSHSTDLLGIKFSHNNLYIVIAPVADPHNNQDTTMQQPDQIQNAQNVTEQVKETTINGTDTQMDERRSLLEDENL
ncbi:25133_t:CDS:2, partial [Gigaspora margarita]